MLLADEEVKWRQISKQLWLKEGDKNTSYFHKCVTQRRRTNSIFKITDERGETVSSNSEVCATFQMYYQNLFMSSNLRGIAEILIDFNPVVTPEMNCQI